MSALSVSARLHMAKGHIYRRRLKTGRLSSWYAVIDAPQTRDGKRRQITRSFPSRQLAEVWLAEQVQRRYRDGEEGVLVGPYLHRWVESQAHLSESTQLSYRGHVEMYLVPHLGVLALSSLTADVIEAVYAHLGRMGLSSATVRRINATLSAALSSAVREGLLASNPAKQVRLPRAEGFTARVWTADEAVNFLRYVEDDEHYLLWRLSLITGLRRGEVLGLRVCDCNPGALRVTVSQTRVQVSDRVVTKSPKTKRGYRNVAIDRITADLLHALVSGLPHQDDLIFTDSTTGQGLEPGWVSRRFKALVLEYGLPLIRFHDLRHTSATLGLAAGESVKEVSARLGHSSVAVTADIYMQVPTSMAQRSAQSLADRLDGRSTEDVA